MTLLAGLRGAARARGIAVRYARGATLAGSGSSLAQVADAVAAARRSDAVVAVLGLDPRLEAEEGDSVLNPAGDRHDLGLPGAQQRLLEALVATGKPVIVVLTGGSALAVPFASAHAAALLDVWYPGEAGGDALADVLFGDADPAGRLPVTFYRSVDDLPPFADYAMRGRTYRYLERAPLYGFGFGLSYTRFRYANLTVAADLRGGLGRRAERRAARGRRDRAGYIVPRGARRTRRAAGWRRSVASRWRPASGAPSRCRCRRRRSRWSTSRGPAAPSKGRSTSPSGASSPAPTAAIATTPEAWWPRACR